MDTITQTLGLLIITLVLATLALISGSLRFNRRRGRPLPALRPVAAYNAVSDLVALGIESNRPLHMAFGSSGLGSEQTLLTIASAELFYQIAQRAAIGEVPPLLSMSDASTLPIAQDTLRRAYQSRDRIAQFSYSSVRWYPAGTRSLAYAAALAVLTNDDDISSSIIGGSSGPELALILEAALRRDLPTLAASDELSGQAVAFAMAEHVLIGEELFAAGTYLSQDAQQLGETLTIDFLRWLVIGVLIALFVMQLINGGG